LVAGSIPAEPRTCDVLSKDFSVADMLEVLLGADGRRKIRLRRRTNTELFQLYDAQLLVKHRSELALSEARPVLSHFQDHLGEFPSSPELATGFLSQFANCKPTTLYRYTSIVNGFMGWYGQKTDIRIKLPEQLPDYIEQDAIGKLKDAMRSKKANKRILDHNMLLIDLACKAALNRELSQRAFLSQ
jgi:hypothetical protein